MWDTAYDEFCSTYTITITCEEIKYFVQQILAEHHYFTQDHHPS